VPGLIKLLDGPDATGRNLAAGVLAAIGPDASDAVPALTRLLGGDGDGRGAAVEALGAIGPAAAAAADRLADLLSDPQASVTLAAVAALARIGEPAVAPLTKRLGREHPARSAAALALAEIGPPAKPALPALEALLDDADRGVRLRAAEAHWRVGGDAGKGLTVIRAGLKDEALRQAAVDALFRVGPPARAALPELTEAVRDPSATVHQPAARALARIGADAVAALREALGDERESVRWSAARALGQIGAAAKDAIPDLEKCAKDGRGPASRAAEDALKKIK
jgi:HEAT repeat protein